MSLLRKKQGNEMPTMRPVTIGSPLVTMSTYEERGETLKRTSIMPDESCFRNSNNLNARNHSNSNNGSVELPPPPPQFANAQATATATAAASTPPPPQPQQQPLKLNALSSSSIKAKQSTPLSPTRSNAGFTSVAALRQPTTPAPDYDAVQLRSNGNNQRLTLRLGTVTIGEYSAPAAAATSKRDTLQRGNLKKLNNGEGHSNGYDSNSNSNSNGNGSASGNNASNGILKNGNRSSASFNRLHSEKSIKFGN